VQRSIPTLAIYFSNTPEIKPVGPDRRFSAKKTVVDPWFILVWWRVWSCAPNRPARLLVPVFLVQPANWSGFLNYASVPMNKAYNFFSSEKSTYAKFDQVFKINH
jgi:hypothetical protein